MFKSRETKKLLNEWRSFINESAPGVNTTRVKHQPTKSAKDLRDELKAIHGEDIFYCYDRFDQHDDEDMIHEEYGYQIEIESLTEHVKGMSDFPRDISVSDIVMTEDDLIYAAGLNGFPVHNLGQFNVPWPTGPNQGGSESYYYGEIDINGRKQKVVYKDNHGYTVYYLWSDSSLNTTSKQFDDEIDDQDDEVLGMFS